MRSLFLHFYPRPPRGGRLGLFLLDLIPSNISIHALREEGDKILAINPHTVKHFYPRPPRGGRPLHPDVYAECSSNFYPRPPRGGRPISAYSRSHPEYFYPRPPRGGRHGTMPASVYRFTFLSTPSARRATSWPEMRPAENCNFYPRPPRGGRLLSSHPIPVTSHHFYPRPPRGGRLHFHSCSLFPFIFLSTPSARRATSNSSLLSVMEKYFYPRPPRGGRRGCSVPKSICISISIHALREEGDTGKLQHLTKQLTFLSTPSARRATIQGFSPFQPKTHFYPRPPRGGRPIPVISLKIALSFLSTPSARRATEGRSQCPFCPEFLSTPSARRATKQGVY